MKNNFYKSLTFIWTIVGLIIVFGTWEFICKIFKIPSWILPSPSVIILEMFNQYKLLLIHTFHTVYGTLLGLFIAILGGVGIGLIIGYSPRLSKALYPLLGGFHALPKVAIVPILVIWFGVGLSPRVITAFLIAFFPIAVNTVTGLTTIEPELYEMLTAWGATKFQIFHKIGLPHTLPYFFAALKVAYGGAFIGEVIGEMVASEEGLGYVIVVASTRLNTSLAFSALLALLLLGYLLFIFFDTIERKGASWAYRAPGVAM